MSDVNKKELFSTEDYVCMQRCKEFPYSIRKDISKVFPISLGILAVMIFASAISGAYLGGREEAVYLILIVGLAIFFGFILKVLQVDQMRELTQYFRDEKGDFFKVVFTRGASMISGYAFSFDDSNSNLETYFDRMATKAQVVSLDKEDAQSRSAAYYYVKRYKAGIRDHNFMYGGLAKVKPLGRLKLLRRGIRKSLYLSDYNGRKRLIRILNGYRGLAETCSYGD